VQAPGGGLNFVATLSEGHNFSGASRRLSFAIESAAQIAIAANLTVGRCNLKRPEGCVEGTWFLLLNYNRIRFFRYRRFDCPS